MIILDSTAKLQIVLGAAVTSAQSKIAVSYSELDQTGATDTPAVAIATTNSATPVDVVTAPASGKQRLIKSLQLVNADTGAIAVTLQTVVSAVAYPLGTFTLQVGDNLMYVDGGGFAILDTNGQIRNTGPNAGRLLRAPQILTAGTTYTIPAGCNGILIELVGGGGGGGGTSSSASNAAAGGGGASGAYLRKYIANPQTSTITYAIGGGGTAGANTGGTGGTGGNTTFGVNAVTYSSGTAGGGVGQTFGTSVVTVTPGAGVAPSNGDININGRPGSPGLRFSGTVAMGGNGGSSPLGPGGLGLNTNGDGAVGGVYGGGGAGACSLSAAQVGGVGGAGCIIVWEYA